jgi:hypothetical protein
MIRGFTDPLTPSALNILSIHHIAYYCVTLYTGRSGLAFIVRKQGDQSSLDPSLDISIL